MAEPQEGMLGDGNDGAATEPVKAASEQDLPVVEAPKLDGSSAAAPAAAAQELPKLDGAEPVAAPAATAVNDEARKPANETADAAALSRSLRFALLAASVAAAAALGSFVGSLSASGVARLWPGAAAGANLAVASAPQNAKGELAELSALKSSLDGASRSTNSQFAKLADRLDRLERGQIEPAVKLGHIADAVDRLEKKGLLASAAPAAPETTGSITGGSPAAQSEARLSDKILQDWVVQEARGGRVLVASRYGGVFEVMTGAILPGLGRVEAIKRQDGQWVVVTASGRILER